MRLTFLSFSFSLLVGTTLAADCGGSQHLSHAVFDSYDKYHQACDVAMSSTNGGYGFHEQDSLNIKMQVQLTASHVNNGYAGMQNIVDQCFRNGWNGEVWSWDGEWYYMERFFDDLGSENCWFRAEEDQLRCDI